MEKKYDDKIVKEYINGDDIDGYNVDDLENDPLFMMQVIDATNDKNMYNLTSDNARGNYDFVLYLIKKYPNDAKFIMNVADNYLDLNKNNKEEKDNIYELNAIMCSIFKLNYADSKTSKYHLSATICYKETLYVISDIKKKLNMEEKEYVGLGFIIVQKLYWNNPEIIKYNAKRFIHDIFFANSKYPDFCDLMHHLAQNYDEIEKVGVVSFLINFVKCYDANLASYLACNPKLLDEIKAKTVSLKDGWDEYVIRVSNDKLDDFLNSLDEYFMENKENESLTLFSTRLALVLVNDYDLRKKIIKKCMNKNTSLERLFPQISDVIISDNATILKLPENLTFADKKFVNYGKKEFDLIFSDDYLPKYEDFSDYEEKSKHEAKIINILQNKKRRDTKKDS